MISRIKQLLDWQQLSPTQFADRIGVGRPVVSHILSERNKPSLEVVQRILAAFPALSIPWLLNGSGNMLADGATAIPGPTSSSLPAAPAVTAPELAQSTERIAPEETATLAAPPAATPRLTQQLAVVTPPPARFMGASRSVASDAGRSSAEPAAGRFVVRGAAAKREPAAPSYAAPYSQELTAPVADVAPESISPPAAPAAEVPPAPALLPLSSAAAGTTPTAQDTLEAAEAVGMAQALAGGFGATGKSIRRIVIFYSDGSFADFKPES